MCSCLYYLWIKIVKIQKLKLKILEIRRVFNKYDKNKLGYIRVQKIIEVFIKVGQNPSKTLEQTLLNQAYKQGV